MSLLSMLAGELSRMSMLLMLQSERTEGKLPQKDSHVKEKAKLCTSSSESRGVPVKDEEEREQIITEDKVNVIIFFYFKIMNIIMFSVHFYSSTSGSCQR